MSDDGVAVTSAAGVDLERIKTLIEFFPIGKKLRYYPEFKQEIVFDTLMVAYCVNGHFVYSLESIESGANGLPAAFRIGEAKKRIPVSALKTFQLLVPDTSDLEMKLDYQRRALIGRGKQFNKGNYISLISNAGVRGMSTVDTEVDKKLIMPDGPYAQTTMVLLDPQMASLSVTDQRRKNRTRISVPVSVSGYGQLFEGAYVLVDISENAVRVRTRDRDVAMPPMRSGDEVVLGLDLGAAERHYSIKGAVIRSSAETTVVRLVGQYVNGRYSPLSPLDLLEFKSALLNYA